MVISSLLVEAFPDNIEQAAKHLENIEHVEVHGIENNQIIVTIETDTVEESHDTASTFINIEGVANVNLIYANFEDDPFIKKAASR